MLQIQSFLQNEFNLPVTIVSEVLSYFIEEQFPKDYFLVKEGQQSKYLYLLKKGYTRFFSYSDEKTITHWIFGKDQMVTDIASFFTHQPAKWNIQTLTETHVYTLSFESHKRLRSTYPEWDHYEKLFLIKLMSALENRVYAFLSMSTEERYQYLFQSDPKMFNELPLQYLASMLRMTPETLSRIRRKSFS